MANQATEMEEVQLPQVSVEIPSEQPTVPPNPGIHTGRPSVSRAYNLALSSPLPEPTLLDIESAKVWEEHGDILGIRRGRLTVRRGDEISIASSRHGAMSWKRFWTLTFFSVGVIYGDIGTSPLYTLQATFQPFSDVGEVEILGALCLVLWSLTFVVFIKYLIFVLSADNNGEGGIFALAGLIRQNAFASRSITGRASLYISIVGAAMLVSDGVLTPAISVLSALEGIADQAPSAEEAVVPLTLVVLIILFLCQRFGTNKVGMAFAPVMTLWFFTIGAIGIYNFYDYPIIWKAFNPVYMINFFKKHGYHGWHQLGSILLCLTGAEAMYADMGHFGVNPIRVSWTFVVYPMLVLTYLGQGARLMRHPEDAVNPFYRAVPQPIFWPVLVLATMASVIASQAVISAGFSLIRQAITLRSLPHLNVTHMSKKVAGQVYVPFINYVLMILTIIVVVIFQKSANLADAYGVAVTSIMVLTTILLMPVMHRKWNWHPVIWVPISITILFVDLNFVGSAFTKVPTGGWFPLVLSVVFSFTMVIWRYGNYQLHCADRRNLISLKMFVDHLTRSSTPRVQGVTGVYVSLTTEAFPRLMTSLINNKVVFPEKIVLCTIQTKESHPFVLSDNQIDHLMMENIGLHRVVVKFGFADATERFAQIVETFLRTYVTTSDNEHITFYCDTALVIPDPKKNFIQNILITMYDTVNALATGAHEWLGLPPERALQIGSPVLL